LNAKVTIFADKENYDFIEPIKKDLVTVFIVSDFELKGYDEASDGKYYEDPDVKGIRVNISMARDLNAKDARVVNIGFLI